MSGVDDALALLGLLDDADLAALSPDGGAAARAGLDRALHALQRAMVEVATPDAAARARGRRELHAAWASELAPTLRPLAELGAGTPQGAMLRALASVLDRASPPTDAEMEAALGPALGALEAPAAEAREAAASAEIQASVDALFADLVILPFGGD